MCQTDDRAKLKAHFAGDTTGHQERWSSLWDKGDFLPFDRGFPNPALVDTLTDRHDLVGTCFVDKESGGRRRKKALVPGCGRGYDVLLLASFGYDAYGLEVSGKAVEKCLQEQKENEHKYPVKDESRGGGHIAFVHGDFFSDEWTTDIEGGGEFDLIYDYTFLSALPPSMRPAWALRMSELLAPKSQGHLICIEFPTYKDPMTGGPPYGLPPKVYVEHLSHPGKKLPYDDEGHVKEGVSEQAGPEALERIGHWQPERTHAIGKGTDWVSVWRHR